jgi:hypothetical protein
MNTRRLTQAERKVQADQSIAYYKQVAEDGDSSMRLGLYMSVQWRKLLDEPQPDLTELQLFARALEGNGDFHGSQWHYMSLAVKWWVETLKQQGNKLL